MSDTKTNTETKPKTTRSKSKENRLVLPRYMRLAKGGLWRDTEGQYASGVTVYSLERIMVGKAKGQEDMEPPLDQFENKNLREYGYIKKRMPWYFDLKEIPKEKLGRIIIAYKAGVLVKADPTNPPKINVKKLTNEWKLKEDGALVFNGRNKEMFKKLQNLKENDLKDFVNDTRVDERGFDNLMDLYHYEQRGFNKFNRPRLEVLDLIRAKLKQFGPHMTGIKKNEDIE